jgi:hypothetical protein
MDSAALLNSISALRNSISALNNRSDSLEVWLYFWVALVAIGVVMEVWFVIWEYREDLAGFRRGTIRSPDSPSVKKLLVHTFAAGLVAIGVSGEFVIDIKAGSIQTDLRTKNGELNRILGDASSVAVREAAGAMERAALAESHLAQAQADAESARALAKGYEAQIADSNARVKKAEAQVASANATAEQARSMAEAERLERVRLEAVVAPRSLSLEQQRRIAAACSPFIGHRVVVESYGLDGEAAGLGAQIIALLRPVLGAANVLDSRASSMVSGGFELGVHVRGPASENDFVGALRAALSSIGQLQTFSNDARPQIGTMMGGGGRTFTSGDFVTVMVGVKPVPTLGSR